MGGWIEPATADLFTRFADRVAEHLGDIATRFCTFNEPNMVATIGYLAGRFPPGGQGDREKRRKANDVFVDAHHKAMAEIKGRCPDVPAGLTLAMQQMWPVGDTPEALDAATQRAARILDGLEDVFLRAAVDDDYIGVQTYSRTRVGPEGTLGNEDGVETTIMGYEFWPEALEATIRRAWDMTQQTPILVTENGIAATDDTRRVEYVRRALKRVLACLDDGIDVRGYTYWSLLDNFEWASGYGPTFGLIGVDRDTQERTVKPSARWLGSVARANAIEL
jgi:beta-glucosidase